MSINKRFDKKILFKRLRGIIKDRTFALQLRNKPNQLALENILIDISSR